jgi:hypothetical protein
MVDNGIIVPASALTETSENSMVNATMNAIVRGIKFDFFTFFIKAPSLP